MRDRLIDVFTHLDEHISYNEEYGILFDTPFVKAVEDVLQMLKGVTVQEWISVKDRLPDREDANEGGFVLAHTEEKVIIMRWGNVCRFPEFVTHWMPLPQPPKGE